MFKRVRDVKGNTDLHPTLVALLFVLSEKGDLGDINRVHPGRLNFKYFNANAEFPDDISGFLPAENHWWEELGA